MSQQEAEDDMPYGLTPEQLQSVRNAFTKVAVEDKIPVKKLPDMMAAFGINLNKGQMTEILDSSDPMDTGFLELEDLIPNIASIIKAKEDEIYYKNLFRILDKKSRGFIGVDDLRYILMGLREEVGISEDEVNEMILEVDDDGNGEVSFHEFHTLMTSE